MSVSKIVLAAFLLFAYPIHVSAQNPTIVLKTITKIYPMLQEDKRGQCTAFPVGIVWVSAGHCIPTIDTEVLVPSGDDFDRAVVVKVGNENPDLSLFTVGRSGVKPLQLAANPPEIGETLYIVGYGEDSPFPFYFAGAFMGNHSVSGPQELGIINVPGIGGMSGCPVVNAAGEVVGVNVSSSNRFSGFIPLSDLKKFLRTR